MPWPKLLGSRQTELPLLKKETEESPGIRPYNSEPFFDTTPEFWMNLQTSYELRLAEKALPKRVRRNIEAQRNTLVVTQAH